MSTILIAEDDKNIRISLMKFLCNEGFSTLTANNGLAAIILALQHIPDIIISDVHMPVMDGFELLKKIKENRESSHIPLIFLTSDAAVNNVETCMLKGAIACFSKPFIFNDLLDAINLSLANKEPHRLSTNKDL